jgi:hypothetical protein
MVRRLYLDHTFLEALFLAHLSIGRTHIPGMLDWKKRQNMATAVEVWSVFQKAGPLICATSTHEVERTITNIFRELKDHACACEALDQIGKLRIRVRVPTKAHYRKAMQNFRSDDTKEHGYEVLDVISYTLIRDSGSGWLVLAFHDHARAAQGLYGFNVVGNVNEAQSFAGLLGSLGSYTHPPSRKPQGYASDQT